MNSTDSFTSAVSDMAKAESEPKRVAAIRPAVRIKELSERDRRRLLMHFLALGDSDRHLRFGSVLPDELITRYVQRMDFARDTIFGVYDDALHLVAVGHLAFAPREAFPAVSGNTLREQVVEFGVSVSEAARGKGVGTKLFERAAIHCRNAGVDTLYMHCLASNHTMMHIAKKAGMAINMEHGEADAFLHVLPATAGSIMNEAVDEQVATFDFAMKANACAANKWLGNFPRLKLG